MDRLVNALKGALAIFSLKGSVGAALMVGRNRGELLIDDLKTIALRCFVFLAIGKLIAGIGAQYDWSGLESVGCGASILAAFYGLVGLLLTYASAGGFVLAASAATEIPGTVIDGPKFRWSDAWDFVRETAWVVILVLLALGVLAFLPVHREPFLALMLAFPCAVLLLDRIQYGPTKRPYFRVMYMTVSVIGLIVGIVYIASPATVAGPYLALKERTKNSTFSERSAKLAAVRDRAEKARLKDEVSNVTALQKDVLEAEHILRACTAGNTKRLAELGVKKCAPKAVLEATIAAYKGQIEEVKRVAEVGEPKKPEPVKESKKDEKTSTLPQPRRVAAVAVSAASTPTAAALLPPPQLPGSVPSPPVPVLDAPAEVPQPSQSIPSVRPVADPFQELDQNQDLTRVSVTQR